MLIPFRSHAQQHHLAALAAVDGQLLAPDEPLLDNLTVGDYLDLPDAKRAHLQRLDRALVDAVPSVGRYSWETVIVLER